jgi:recyclin-1
MDRFRTLEPVRLHGTAGTTNGGGSGAGGAPAKPQQIGRLSAPIHARIATYLAIPDVPAYARTCKALNKIFGELGQGQGDSGGWERQVGVAEEGSISFWEARWRALGVDEEGGIVNGASGTGSRDGPGGMEMVLDALEARLRGEAGASQARQPAALLVPDDGDLGGVGMMDGGGIDDFGDFADADTDAPKGGQMDEFVGAFGALSTTAPRTPKFVAFSSSNINGAGSSSTNTSKPDQPSYKTKYMRAHRLLKPLLPALSEPPHAILSALFPPLPASSSSLIGLGISSMATHTSSGEPSLALQSSTLRLLSRWLSPLVQPVRRWEPLRASLRGAMDRFEAALLAAFDGADTRGDESGMREAAYAAWAVYDADGDAASSSISEDIDVFGGDLGGRLGLGGGSGGWELARAWADKREVFYEAQRFRAEENVTCVRAHDFVCFSYTDLISALCLISCLCACLLVVVGDMSVTLRFHSYSRLRLGFINVRQ